MGYTRNAAIRALTAQKDNAEAAIMWIMENMDNPSLNDPIEEESSSGPSVDAGALAQVIEMGFEEFQAKIALIKHVLFDNMIEIERSRSYRMAFQYRRRRESVFGFARGPKAIEEGGRPWQGLQEL